MVGDVPWRNLTHNGSLRLDTNSGVMDTFPFAGFLLKERGRVGGNLKGVHPPFTVGDTGTGDEKADGD